MAYQRSAVYAVVRGLWFLFILAVVLPVALFAAAQTRVVKDWLAVQISAAASDVASTVTIGRIDGLVPVDITIDSVMVADADGEWLTTEDIELRWSPLDLLDGTLRVERAAAKKIVVARTPSESADASSDATQPFAFESPVAIVIEQADLPRIELGEPVAGVAAVFGMGGMLGLDPDRGTLSIDLAAERKDGVPGSAKLIADYVLAEHRATLDLSAEEPPGGVIAGLIGLPEPAAVLVSAKGDGTLADWAGTIAARIDGYATLSADVSLKESDGGHLLNLNASGEAAELVAVFVPDAAPIIEPGFTLSAVGNRDPQGRIALNRLDAVAGPTKIELSGQFDPATLGGDLTFQARLDKVAEIYAPEVAPIIAAGIDGHLAGAYNSDGVVSIDKSRVASGPVGFGAKGTIDTMSATLGLDVEIAVAALDGFSEMAGAPLAGALTFTGRVDGPLDAAAVSEARFSVTEFATDAVSFARLEGRLSASPEGAWTEADPTVNFDGEGFVSALSVEGQKQILEALAAERVDWHAAGRSQPISGMVTLSDLSLASDTVIAGGTAALRADGPVTAAVFFELDAIDKFAALAGTTLAGRLNATVDLSGDIVRQDFEATVDARLQEFKSGIEPADIALGPQPTLAATAHVDGTGAITVRDLSLRGAALAADGTLGLAADQSLSGALRVGVSDLAPYSSLAGTPVEGTLAVALKPGGGLAAPIVGVSFTGTDISVDGSPPADITGQLTGYDLMDQPRGTIALAASANGTDATAKLDYLVETTRLGLTDLEARAAGLEIQGDVTAAFDSGLISGQLAGRADDIGTVAALAGLTLGGAMTFDAAFDARDGEQAIALGAEARGLKYPAADLAVGLTALSANGVIGDLDVELDVTDGTVSGRTVSFNSTANIGITEAATRITVETMKGELDALPIALTQAATITQQAEGVSLNGLSLMVAEGIIEADGDLRAAETQALITATDVSLAEFGAGVEGVLTAEATLSGAAPHPDAIVMVRIEGLRDSSLAAEDLPSLHAALDARWAGGMVDADAALTAPGGARLGGTVSMPVSLDPDTLTPEFRDDATLVGRVEGAAELAEFAPLVLSDLDRLEGKLTLDLDITGTLAAPSASGRASIENGFYENGVAGTVLTDFVLEIEGDGQNIVVRQLAATDGGGGTINGTGRIGVDPTGDFPTKIEVAFANFLAVRRAEAEIPLDGSLVFDGDLSGYTLAGLLTVPQAEIRIPDTLPANVVKLDVVEVGGVVDASAPQSETEKVDEAPPVPIMLDVGVEMPGRIFLRGRGLTSEWRGAVTAKGPVEAPVVVGELNLVRGTFDLIGKVLTLERGTVTLAEEAPDDPEISALATAPIEGSTARVEISGRASNPQIALSAEPPLPEDEVLARLLFGSSVGKLTAIQAVQLANGIATLTGKGAGLGLIDRVRTTAGIDTLDVRSDGESGGNTSVRAGKYLADDVILYIEQGRGSGNSKATLEVDINDYLSVETDVGADSQGSIGVNIKTDY